jgi:hypothetical protein
LVILDKEYSFCWNHLEKSLSQLMAAYCCNKPQLQVSFLERRRAWLSEPPYYEMYSFQEQQQTNKAKARIPDLFTRKKS